MTEKMKLEVIEANRKYQDKNIATIASDDMDSLGLVSGNIVKVSGEKNIHLRIARTNNSFKGKIGINGDSRSVIGISVGEEVEISKIEKVPELKSVTLSILPHEDFSNEELKQYNSQLKSYGKIKDVLVNSPVSSGQKISFPTNVGKLSYSVTSLTPKKSSFGIITEDTKIDLSDEVGEGSGINVYYEDIGGLKEEVAKVREMVEFPMKHPEIFKKLGVGAPKGVLMTGPPGTGKTLLAKAVANETDSEFYSINGPEIMSKYYGESEKQLRETFEKAQKNSPAIVFIDEIDSIAPKRGEGTDQTEKRVVSQLLSLMDGLKSRGQVVVMAATNRPDDIDEALRRPGRFDRELKINPPSEEGRREILQIHTRGMPLGKDVDFNEISRRTIGYTGADIEVLCKEAALRSVRPFYSSLVKFEEESESADEKSQKDLEEKKNRLISNISVGRNHFIEALKQIEPSAMREVLINKPHLRWSDVGGLTDAKEKLRELVELPLIRPDLYSKAGINPSKGVLLYGPPGTGKTMLAKAVATEANANFISVKGPELMSKWVGESEKRVREIFKKAKEVAPTIIFFDEFDSISKQRGGGMNDATEKVVNQLLSEMDGIEELEKVMVVAATNRRDLVDPALLRPGRIDSQVELKVPDKNTREQIFKVHTKKMPLIKELENNLKQYVDKTENWTGAEVESLARNAGINAIKRVYKDSEKKELTITKQDFDQALEEVSKSIGKEISGGEKSDKHDKNQKSSQEENKKDKEQTKTEKSSGKKAQSSTKKKPTNKKSSSKKSGPKKK